MTDVDRAELDARVRGIANRWPCVGLAVGAVRDGSLAAFAAFRIAFPWFGVGTCRVVFTRRPGTGTTALHLDVGPLSLQKRHGRGPR